MAKADVLASGRKCLRKTGIMLTRNASMVSSLVYKLCLLLLINYLVL